MRLRVFSFSFKKWILFYVVQDQKKAGVIAASAGNHALALSYHGQDLGIPVTVIMPHIAPLMKIQNCRNFGANVKVMGADISEVINEMCVKYNDLFPETVDQRTDYNDI